MFFGTISPKTRWRNTTIESDATIEKPWVSSGPSAVPSNDSITTSNAGSPTYPSASDAIVMPS